MVIHKAEYLRRIFYVIEGLRFLRTFYSPLDQWLMPVFRGQNPVIRRVHSPDSRGRITIGVLAPGRSVSRKAHRRPRQALELEAGMIGGELVSFGEVKNLLTF